MAIIILEGPDGAGKTTLAKTIIQIAQKQGADLTRKETVTASYLHLRGQHGKNPWHSLFGSLRLAALKPHNHLTVIDRHFMSYDVYGDLYRPGQFDHVSRYAHRYAIKLGAYLVNCVPNYEKVVKELPQLTDPDHPYTEAQYKMIWSRYAGVPSTPPFRHYSWIPLCGTPYDRFKDDLPTRARNFIASAFWYAHTVNPLVPNMFFKPRHDYIEYSFIVPPKNVCRFGPGIGQEPWHDALSTQLNSMMLREDKLSWYVAGTEPARRALARWGENPFRTFIPIGSESMHWVVHEAKAPLKLDACSKFAEVSEMAG